MWEINNQTPYAAERNWAVDKNGEKSWIVVVKATFDILPKSTLQIAEKQEEALLQPIFRGDPAGTSILYEADLTAAKSNTDIILNGHAYAIHGRLANKVPVTIKVGNISKQLMVFGDRVWEKNYNMLTPSQPQFFEKMPVIYERAFGGLDTKHEDPSQHRIFRPNPIGVGFAAKAEHLVGTPLPNIENPRTLISSWNDHPFPAGFGAIASYWSPRFEFAGTYDDQWKKNKFPLLPEDFNPRYFQCAPVDQQSNGWLKGGEKVELYNLTPSGSLSFSIPKISFGFLTFFGRQREEHRAVLGTVIIEPDMPRVILVWHTSLPCHHKVDKLDYTAIFEKEYIV